MFEYLASIFNNTNESEDSSKHHGIGVFHSGVEICGKEYCFGGHEVPNLTGVFVVEPKIGIPELTLKQTIDMGTTDLTEKEIEELLLTLSDEFMGPSYNLLSRNCNHFTEGFVERLNSKTVPFWINRAAKLGNMFPCVVPWEWIQPPELSQDDDDDDDNDDDNSMRGQHTRRSSTISLLSNPKNARSTSYNSTNEGSQERLIPAQPIVKFQGIILPENE
ncbi:PPPDE putative peptidase domain-containing protein [Helicostylum pulchrum]|nr:PPPDE putative peptidase domain-containing protein [Helicostylum pulchrum]